MDQQTKPTNGKKRPRMAVVVGKKCRLIVPQHIRESLGLKEGDTLLSFVEDGRCKIMTEAQAYEHIAKATSASAPSVLVVGKKFRLVIPQHIREELGIHEGDTLLSFVEDGRWIIMTKAQARKRMDDAIRAHPEAANMVELLYEDRRRDFEKEQREEAEALERYRESHGG